MFQDARRRCCHALSRRGFFKGAAPRLRRDRRSRRGQAAPRSFSKVVDLTHTMSPDFPTFFGVPGIELQRKQEIKKDGFNLNWWRIIEHAGTHLDAPIHFSTDGAHRRHDSADALVVPLAVDRCVRQGA